VGVALGGGELGVAEPHLDDLGRDAAAVALAGEGVAEEVRVDVFFKASVAGGSGGDPPEDPRGGEDRPNGGP